MAVMDIMKMTKIRTYTDFSRYASFIDRFRYLKLRGSVGASTFGYDRYLNQLLYTSREWKMARDHVILRDNGCDLGVEGYDVKKLLTIHHMNPITPEDIERGADHIFDPEFLVCTSARTHSAIHYGDESLLPQDLIVRKQNDTCPWRV